MERIRRAAFTLAELLVVVAVIVLLVALAFPSFANARRYSRQTKCQANLYHIGEAFGAQRAFEKLGSGRALSSANWSALLLEHLSYVRQALLCPEDQVPNTGMGWDTSTDTQRSAAIWVSMGSGYTIDLFGYAEGTMPWNLKAKPDNTDFLWKMSEAQYQAWFSIQHEKKKAWDFMYPYDPGPNPSVYYYAIEDGRSPSADFDYEDINVRVEERSDGSAIVSIPYKGYTVYHFNLLDADGNIVAADLHGGESLALPATQTGMVSAQETSYGMVNLVRNVAAKKTIICLDYEALVANCAGTGAIDGWTQSPHWNGGSYAFARHFAKCNALFSDGSVQLMNPLDIDPSTAAVRNAYWEP